MSKNEISRTISCIYFMKIWVDLGFELSEVSLVHTYTYMECNTTSEEDLPVVGFTRQFPSTRPEAEY